MNYLKYLPTLVTWVGLFLICNLSVFAQTIPSDVNLTFSTVTAGTIADKDGQGTGFTSVQTNSAGNAYNPALLDLSPSTGTLILTATKGNNSTNNLKNGLQVAVDSSQYPFTITARLKGPLTNLQQAYQQGGISLGSGQNNYVKFVIINQSSGPNGLGLKFTEEQNGVVSTVGGGNAAQVTGLNWSSITTLDLYLAVDPTTGRIRAAYRVNSSSAVPTFLSQEFIPTKTASFFGTTTIRAGIQASTNNALDVPVVYDSFSVLYTPTYSLLRSASANRTNPVPLAGQTLNGELYAFTSPDKVATRVDFFLDDPAQTGVPFHTENIAPFDLNGGTTSTAIPV
ncbi:hypothetical protein [Candidatus Cyanaurora vandensis]|uniref:hypothetical protein n=1 Tax=Candidatus Cyanaurora vandensis TaxID=2714958 RepID=UPI00257C6B27|nr:hypothetical protein [Candidatus Cyanaurora vandensis]